MKKVLGFVGFLLVVSSLCWAGGKKDRQNTSIQPQIEPQQAVPPSSNPYFIGEGGKGLTLGIRVPESQGLTENQSYLPTVVQGVLVADMSKYSAIDVLDRVSLDRVINETLDPTFEDNFDIVSLGHVKQVGNWMTGNIIKTSAGYSLQINITDTTSNAKTIASYTGTCTVAQFDDYSVIHRASMALLEQMGVVLTDRAKTELAQASAPQYVNAQTALSQGIIAQQRGTVVEALTSYYRAGTFDPSLLEASTRAATLSAGITSGNIGEQIRNDIQRRNEWIKILTEAATYFKAHPPFELYFNPALEWGTIDYNKEATSLSFYMFLGPDTAALQVIFDLMNGLKSTGRINEWGFGRWPFETSEIPQNMAIFKNNGFGMGLLFGFTINSVLRNGAGETIGNASSQIHISIDNIWRSTALPGRFGFAKVTFLNVKANDISDNLTVSVTSIDGIPAERAAEQGYLRVTSIDPSLDVTADVSYFYIGNFVVGPAMGGVRIKQISRSSGLEIPATLGPWKVVELTFNNNFYISDPIIMPDNINVIEGGHDVKFNSLSRFYNLHGKKAGIYTYVQEPGGKKYWTYRP